MCSCIAIVVEPKSESSGIRFSVFAAAPCCFPKEQAFTIFAFFSIMVKINEFQKGVFTMIEQTYIMLKPDAIKRGLMGEVIARIEKKGYRIVDAKMMTLNEAILREHYAHIADKPFFPEILTYMTSGPVFAMIVEGENAVKGMRILMGATKFEEAAAGTIRGDYAFCTSENIIHGSDSIENAEIEIKRFFG